jgi:hypothetical protein
MHLQRPDVHRRRRRGAPLRRQLAGLREDRLVLGAVLHAVVQVPHLVAAVHLHINLHVRLVIATKRRLHRPKMARNLHAADGREPSENSVPPALPPRSSDYTLGA